MCTHKHMCTSLHTQASQCQYTDRQTDRTDLLVWIVIVSIAHELNPNVRANRWDSRRAQPTLPTGEEEVLSMNFSMRLHGRLSHIWDHMGEKMRKHTHTYTHTHTHLFLFEQTERMAQCLALIGISRGMTFNQRAGATPRRTTMPSCHGVLRKWSRSTKERTVCWGPGRISPFFFLKERERERERVWRSLSPPNLSDYGCGTTPLWPHVRKRWRERQREKEGGRERMKGGDEGFGTS